jgi:hypothetical protein
VFETYEVRCEDRNAVFHARGLLRLIARVASATSLLVAALAVLGPFVVPASAETCGSGTGIDGLAPGVTPPAWAASARAHFMRPPGSLARFVHDFKLKWEAQTSCDPGCAVPDCGHVQVFL